MTADVLDRVDDGTPSLTFADLSVREGVLPLRMICECRLGDEDPFVTDESGFVVCPTHGVRRYGYLSRPRTHDFDWMNDLQYEQHVLWGDEGESPALDIKASAPDMRDNRDPESLVDVSHQGDFGNGGPALQSTIRAKR